MKKPTLEEVKEYFKNAKEVFCLTDNEVVDITKNITQDIHYFMDIYWIGIDHIGGGDVNLWKNGQYATIISYKETEPTTKVRNSVLLQLVENNSFSEEIIRKECPKLFATPTDIITIVEKYGKDKIQEYLNNAK